MNEKVYIPPIKIQGIKTKLVPLIKNSVVLNEKTLWVEPFMGSGVVGFNVEPRQAIFADSNPHIINFYNQIKSGEITPQTVRLFLEREGALLEEGDSDYYYAVRSRFNKEHDPLDFLFLNRSCFNGMIRFNKDYMFNVPYGHKPNRFAKAYITKIVNQVAHVAELTRRYSWSFLCQSFEQTIEMSGAGAFIYCDPPYIGRHVDYYDSWDEQSEIALYHALKNSNANFMLSTWDHNSYRQNQYISSIWSDCHKITRDHYYHVGANVRNRNAVVEALLTNYPITGKDNVMITEEDKQLSIFDTTSA